jgi:hypothetical protein
MSTVIPIILEAAVNLEAGSQLDFEKIVSALGRLSL